jgi:hypothetical protein
MSIHILLRTRTLNQVHARSMLYKFKLLVHFLQHESQSSLRTSEVKQKRQQVKLFVNHVLEQRHRAEASACWFLSHLMTKSKKSVEYLSVHWSTSRYEVPYLSHIRLKKYLFWKFILDVYNTYFQKTKHMDSKCLMF